MSGTKVQIKYGYGRPQDGSLKKAELAIDLDDNSLWTADEDGNIVRVGHDTTEIENNIEEIVKELTETVVHKNESNDVEEGVFRLVWDDSANTDFPFNGSIGYSGGNLDPDSPGGSFLYASGNRGTVTIGRDGDMELHGPSEIKGMANRNGELPWITDFEYVQAGDFRDADGNSIIGPDYIEVDEEKKVITVGTLEFAGDEGNSVAVGMKSFLGGYVRNYSVGVGVDAKAFELSAAIGYCSEARTNSVAVGQGAQAWKSGVAIGNQAGAIHDYSVAIGENAFTEETSQVMFGTTPNASYGTPLNLKTYGTMQATDYLDADGNSIVISELDDIPNVSATNPNRDDLLVWNGSQWEANDFDFIQTALTFKGSTNVANAAPAAEQGDLYVNDTEGEASASWTGISGRIVKAGNFIGYANNRWYLLGDMADVGVTDVLGGEGISVDDSKPSEPVVSVDRDKLDEWYADKSVENLVGNGLKQGDVLVWNGSGWRSNSTINVGNRGEVKFVDNLSALKFEGAGTGGPSLWATDDSERTTGPFFIRAQSFAVKDQANKDLMALSYQGNLKANYFEGDGSKLTNISYTESDPTVGAHIKSITPKQMEEWTEAYQWGNHAYAGYLKSFTESDPVFKASPAGSITSADINKWNNPPTGGGDTNNVPDGTVTGETTYWNGSAWKLTTGNLKLFQNATIPQIYIRGTSSESLASRVYKNFAIGNASSTGYIGKSHQSREGQAGYGAYDSDICIGNSNMGGSFAPIMIDTYTGHISKINKNEDLGGGKLNQTFIHDAAGNLYIHGGITGPNDLQGSQGGFNSDTQNGVFAGGNNVKTWQKLGTGYAKATWDVVENFFATGATAVATASVLGSASKGTAVPFRDTNTDLFVAYRCKQYNVSNTATNGISATDVSFGAWAKPPTTFLNEDGEEVVNEAQLKIVRSDEYKRWVQRFRDRQDNPPEPADPDCPTVWTYPNETGQVILVCPAIMDFDDVLSDFRNGEVLTQRTRDQLPTLQELFDCWRMDGKDIVVDLDLAKAHAMQVLRHQARWYYRSVEADAALFGDDGLQHIKEIVTQARETIEGTTKQTLGDLDDLVGRLRNDDKEETFLFRDWL